MLIVYKPLNTIKILVKIGDMCLDFYTYGVRAR